MRTTVNIDERLVERVKERAREEGSTVSKVVESSLQAYLTLPRSRARVGLPTARSGGLLPGIDPSSNASMFEAADGEASPDGALRE